VKAPPIKGPTILATAYVAPRMLVIAGRVFGGVEKAMII
jgi:hypothetical protein